MESRYTWPKAPYEIEEEKTNPLGREEAYD
jgi:hypothetical protein